MPRGDGSGPVGMGPMTGRGLGYCNNYASPGFTKGTPIGGGFGLGRGRGRGPGFGRVSGFGFWGRSYYPANVQPTQWSAGDEVKAVENQIDFLKKQLSAMEQRLTDLQNQKEE